MSVTESLFISRRELIIASGNSGKIQEFTDLLKYLPLKIQAQPDNMNLNIQERGMTFAENACIKATTVAAATGYWTLADDSGLCVEALNGAPGIYSARYASTEAACINRLLNALGNNKNRKASFQAALCVAAPDGSILAAVEGQCNGHITAVPRGQGGFGYDPIFEVAGVGLTFAEMSPDRKRALGHRGQAFALLEPELIRLVELDSRR